MSSSIIEKGAYLHILFCIKLLLLLLRIVNMLVRDEIPIDMATDLFMAGFFLASAINNSK